jgi:hypothetical protein
VLSRDIKKVAEETAHVVSLYGLPEVDDNKVREMFYGRGKITAARGKKTVELDIKTGLASSGIIDDAIDDEVEYVYIPGAFTFSGIDKINPKKFRHVTFIVNDPTKIFLSRAEWQPLRKKGLNVAVLKNIKIAAISVNPVSPEGYSFEHERLIDIMENALPGIRIIDVKLE